MLSDKPRFANDIGFSMKSAYRQLRRQSHANGMELGSESTAATDWFLCHLLELYHDIGPSPFNIRLARFPAQVVGARHVRLELSLMDQPNLCERYAGALLGLACGDAVGTTAEFQPRG